MPPMIQVSAIVPVFDEQENIPRLYPRLRDALESVGRRIRDGVRR